MPLSMDVQLPLELAPQFPDECVGCGQATPGRHVTIWFEDSRSKLGGLLGARRLHVPACARCGWRVRIGRLVAASLFFAALAVAAWRVSIELRDSSRLVRILTVCALGFVLFIPVTLWRGFRPPSIGVTVVRRSAVTYEFRRPEYAQRFAALNGAAVQPVR
jgi:hypothetical protein